jgi:hypothetical protein
MQIIPVSMEISMEVPQKIKNRTLSQAQVAHASNPGHSGGRDQEFEASLISAC